jgi:hypothetical protein
MLASTTVALKLVVPGDVGRSTSSSAKKDRL